MAGAAFCAAVLALTVSNARHGIAAVAVPSVGVADFYAVSPIAGTSTLEPEAFAADDFSLLLARVGDGRVAVILRAEVLRAEQTLRWRNADVLRFARLSDLAHLLHADRLVVGWIKMLNVERGGGGGGGGPNHEGGGGNGIEAFAVFQIQVFDAAQGRILSQTQSEGDALGVVVSVVAEAAMHRALGTAVAPTLNMLTATP